jgi:hypothetical protein
MLSYKWCLFLVSIGTSLNDWMLNELHELIQHRAMYKKPTVIMDSKTDLVECLRGFGEVIRCDV